MFSRRSSIRHNRGRLSRGVVALPIAGAAVWLRSDLGVTLSGSSVTNWADQSGNGNNANQNVSVGSPPTYNSSDSGYGGKPTVLFNGSQSLTFALPFPNQPFTVYIVGESTSGPGQQQFFGETSNNICILLLPSTNVWGIYAGSVLSSSNSTQGVAQAFSGIFNSSSSALYINTSSSAATSGNAGTLNTGNPVNLGCQPANYIIGKIAEFIVYPGAHSSSQVSQIFQYFAGRYGKNWS